MGISSIIRADSHTNFFSIYVYHPQNSVVLYNSSSMKFLFSNFTLVYLNDLVWISNFWAGGIFEFSNHVPVVKETVILLWPLRHVNTGCFIAVIILRLTVYSHHSSLFVQQFATRLFCFSPVLALPSCNEHELLCCVGLRKTLESQFPNFSMENLGK